MKNIIEFLIIAAIILVSCEPIENRNEMTGSVTEADIEQFIKIDQQTIEGKQSNYFRLSSDGLKANVMFTHGLGTVMTGSNGYIQCFVVPGQQEIALTILNPDGTSLEKTFSVTVEEAFNVAAEWAILCGTGEKVWTWDETRDRVWGNGNSLNGYAPDWWSIAISDINGQMA